MIPLTIYKYKDTGKFTKEKPKKEKLDVDASDEFKARRKALEEALEDGWWVLRIETGPKEIV